jgi:DNA-binding MarR family transcriptional regulator
MYTPLLDELELTYPQYLVLLALWEKDIQAVGELSKRLFLDYNTLTPLLKRLTEKGLIHRNRSILDERSVKISLTEKAISLKDKAFCIPEKLVKTLGQMDFTSDEIQIFRQLLTKLVDKLKVE